MSSFFRALNPTEKHTGFFYDDFRDGCIEMVDRTILENIRYKYISNDSYVSHIIGIFDILMGDHYEIIGRHNGSAPLAKGILDFLIFPLVARSLILGLESIGPGILGLIIALPLEITRFSLGIGLTLLFTPVVAVIDLIQAILPEGDAENGRSLQNSAP